MPHVSFGPLSTRAVVSPTFQLRWNQAESARRRPERPGGKGEQEVVVYSTCGEDSRRRSGWFCSRENLLEVGSKKKALQFDLRCASPCNRSGPVLRRLSRLQVDRSSLRSLLRMHQPFQRPSSKIHLAHTSGQFHPWSLHCSKRRRFLRTKSIAGTHTLAARYPRHSRFQRQLRSRTQRRLSDS